MVISAQMGHFCRDMGQTLPQPRHPRPQRGPRGQEEWVAQTPMAALVDISPASMQTSAPWEVELQLWSACEEGGEDLVGTHVG